MSWRRKRSKGSWSNPVMGAMVINNGGGGGEKVRAKPPQWVRDEQRAAETADNMQTRLTREDKQRVLDEFDRGCERQATKTRRLKRNREIRARKRAEARGESHV